MSEASMTPENETTDSYMSKPELRTYLGYSASTIRRLRDKGMPSVGTGRLRRYHVGSVVLWLSEHG